MQALILSAFSLLLHLEQGTTALQNSTTNLAAVGAAHLTDDDDATPIDLYQGDPPKKVGTLTLGTLAAQVSTGAGTQSFAKAGGV